jgi:hypothetical protein
MVVGSHTVALPEIPGRRLKSGRSCLTQPRAYVSCFINRKAMRNTQQKSMCWRMTSVDVGGLRLRRSGSLVRPELLGGVASSSPRHIRRISGGR